MNLNEEDWKEFRNTYPTAAAWMDRRGLQRERENLQRETDSGVLEYEPKRKAWVESRLRELNTLFAGFASGG